MDDNWLERVWEYREEVVYPELFGPEFDGVFPIPAESAGDPRWSTCGVFRFAPTESRPSWLYVSSGLSNAWFDEIPDPSGTSGFGCEFLMETLEKADWPIIRLHQIMKYQIDLCCGKYPGRETLDDGNRIPLRGPVDFKESLLDHLILTKPANIPAGFQQESGSADFYLLFGITSDEKEMAKQHGHDVLMDRIRDETRFPVTDPARRNTTI